MAPAYKILYVDDEVDNLVVFKSVFRSDFSIHTFSSPCEAYETLQKENFHIVIADQRMPEMTGVELLEKVHQTKVEPVRILLTGYSDAQALIDAINKARVFYCSTKPWKSEDLKSVLMKAIEYYEKKAVCRSAKAAHE
jgi:response regulator RpfG family c-di-GMP phosphodiesterase